MSREISDMFDDRTRVLQFADSTSKTLSDFVWGELLTIPGSRSHVDNRELFERSSFQNGKDVSTLGEVKIPDWAAEHQRRIHGEWQDSAPAPQTYRTPADRGPARNYRPEEQHTDRRIGPGPNGVPGVPPEGYTTLRRGPSQEAVGKAWSLIGGEYGTQTPFQMAGRNYMARIEPHYGPTRDNPKPHWHKGVTLYER